MEESKFNKIGFQNVRRGHEYSNDFHGNQDRRLNRGVFKRRHHGIPKADINDVWKHDMFEVMEREIAEFEEYGRNLQSAELLVSNLHYGVSESDLFELFSDFGKLHKVSMHYDRSGRSLGKANVCYERRSDALEAMERYNGVPLDGQPLKIEIASITTKNRNVVVSRQMTSPIILRGAPDHGNKIVADPPLTDLIIRVNNMKIN